jgi:hypothetical protein
MSASNSSSSVDDGDGGVGGSGGKPAITFNSRGEVSVFPAPSGPNEENDEYEDNSLMNSGLSRTPSCFADPYGIMSCLIILRNTTLTLTLLF